MVPRALWVSALLIVAVAASQPPSDDLTSTFPQGRGRDTMIRVCSGCHGAESAVAQYRSHEDWVKTLDEMATNGAQASDAEWDEILVYIDKNFARIFVNKATAKEIATMLGVSPEAADAIVRRRTDNGEFQSIEDLKRVSGIAAAAIEARKERLIF